GPRRSRSESFLAAWGQIALLSLRSHHGPGVLGPGQMTARPTGTIDVIPMDAPTGANHVFHAVAYVENLSLKDLASMYPEARRTPHTLRFRTPSGGDVYIYPFGAIVFRDVPLAERDAEAARLACARPGLTSATVIEDFTVREDPGSRADVSAGALTIDKLTPERATVIALT